jgi:hypothetical protein
MISFSHGMRMTSLLRAFQLLMPDTCYEMRFFLSASEAFFDEAQQREKTAIIKSQGTSKVGR